MSNKSISAEEAARIGGEAATKRAMELGTAYAMDRYEKMMREQKRKRSKSRLRDTKRLLLHYHEIKAHAADAISSLSEVAEEDYDFFKRLMEDDDSVDVQAIITSKVRSSIMLAHVDAMLTKYKEISVASRHPEDARRYRVLEAMCLREPKLSAFEIAERESIHERTVYKDFDAACEKMSALLFGIQWIEREAEC